LNLFQEECALTSAYTTPAAATPIVISCLPCVPLTSVAHGRRSPKRNMTLTKTVSAYAYQAADTRHTKLTSQAGTTRATRFYGARHILFAKLEKEHPDHFAVKQYRKFKLANRICLAP